VVSASDPAPQTKILQQNVMKPKDVLGEEPDVGAQIIERFYYPTEFGYNHIYATIYVPLSNHCGIK